MTCIAAVADGERVWIGGDSAGVAGWSLNVRADEKVFANGPFVMGFTSSFRMGQLLRYCLTPPERDPECDLDRYMATSFIDAVRKCLKDGGFARKNEEAESGGTFIVGIAGSLFVVGDDYQVSKLACGYAAVGCGDQVAAGALYASKHLDPERRVRLALEAAEAHSSGVRSPFVIKHTGLIALGAEAVNVVGAKA